VGALEEKFWINLCRLLDREEFIPHQFATGKKREEIFSNFRGLFREKTLMEWTSLLTGKDTCVHPSLTLEEAISDPQCLARAMVIDHIHPTEGNVRQVGFPMKLHGTPASVRLPAPALGEHTDETLLHLGYTDEDLVRFRESGVI